MEPALAAARPTPDMASLWVYSPDVDPASSDFEAPRQPDGEAVTMVSAINRTLHEIFEENEEAILFGEDVARRKGGVFKATQDLTERFGADRNVVYGLLVSGVASGLAQRWQIGRAHV